MTEAAVLFDRDGVLLQGPEEGFPIPAEDTENVMVYPEAPRAVAMLAEAGVPMAVVSNQASVGRGIVTMAALEASHIAMEIQLGHAMPSWYCMHKPEDDCACRKPMPLNLLRALRGIGGAPEKSFMIGDWTSDWRAARAIGVLPLMVLTGRGPKAQSAFTIALGPRLAKMLTFANVLDAVSFALDAMNFDLERQLNLSVLR